MRKNRNGNHRSQPELEERKRRVPPLFKNYLKVSPIFSHILLNFLVFPSTRCRLKLLKSQRIQDFLLLEEEYIQNQEQIRPKEQKQEVISIFY